MGIIKYENKIKTFGSDLGKSYVFGATDLNKLKFKPNMGDNHPGNPPILARKTPTEKDIVSPPERGPVGARVNDIVRLTKLLTQANGLKFLANNLALSNSIEASYIRKPEDILSRTSTLSKKELLQNAKAGLIDTALLVGSTLAQVGVSGTGTHFVRGFDRNQTKYLKDVKKISSAILSRGDVSGFSVRYTSDAGKEDLDSFNLGANTDTINIKEPKKSTEEGEFGLDLIKFYFEILEPTNLKQDQTPDKTVLFFRAYLDSLNDSFTGNWNSFNYVGRGEQFHTYQGFDRSVDFGFKVAAASKAELMPIYRKLNYLVSSTAPSYSKDGFMRGTMTKITIGDYFSALPGFISQISLSWDLNYPWEIKYYNGEGSDADVQQLPTVLNVKVNFTPIHTFAPQSNYLHSETGREFTYIGD